MPANPCWSWFSTSNPPGAYRCDGPPHEFVELILGLADHNSTPIEIGVKAVELVAGAYESARANAPVKVAP